MRKKNLGYNTLPEIKSIPEEKKVVVENRDDPAKYVVSKFLRRGFETLTPEDLATTIVNPDYPSTFRAKTGEDWNAKYKSRVIERLDLAKFDISWYSKASSLNGQFKPLFDLCKQGNVGSVVEYVKTNGNDCLFAVDGTLNSPLHVASINGHTQLVEALANMGSNLEARDVLLKTPLHLAVSTEQETVVTSLIALGADLLAKDSVY